MREVTKGAIDQIRNIRGIGFDMDGTTYLGESLLGGVEALISLLDKKEIPYIFLTNNSSKTKLEYSQKLSKMGLNISEDKILTSQEATWLYLRYKYPDARIGLFATPSVKEEARSYGILLEEQPDKIEIVVLAFDTTITYNGLVTLCNLISKQLPFIATHPDIVCPVPEGVIPDVGAFLSLIFAVTHRSPDIIIGKPNQPMVSALCDKMKLRPHEIAYIGDRLYTDVAMANKSGMLSVLVLTGETKENDLVNSPFVPDLIISDLFELIDILRR